MRPVTIEKWARASIAIEVQNRVAERLHVIDDSRLLRSAERILARNNKEIAEAKAALSAQLPSRIALIMEYMLHPDCPCRQRATEMEHDIQKNRIESLQKNNAQVTRLIESKYRDVAQSLLKEVKIFSAANGIVLLLLTATAFWWKRPALQLLAPAVVMGGAAALTFAIYLFNQDWLQTILFGDYIGFYYIPYLLVALSFLADVVLNRGRLTMVLLGGTLAALGGIFSVASC
ncbi:hypothetical protein C7C56_023830 [Massilia glaciei]|uniref:Uncharacterized protein n=2 Tax=Massilia glaciei TaxID=1524097 RepID=A0A2U2HEE9_9BURK|nr:hypothetical protein C7C56_023830 [Massilia glaciei]